MFDLPSQLRSFVRTSKNIAINFKRIWPSALLYSIPAAIKLTATGLILITPFAIYNKVTPNKALRIIKGTLIAGAISYPLEVLLTAYNFNRMVEQYSQDPHAVIRPEDKVYQNISHPHIDFLETSSSLLLLFWLPPQNPLWFLLGGMTLGLRTFFSNNQTRNHNIQASNYPIEEKKSNWRKFFHAIQTAFKRSLDISILFLNYAAPIYDALSYSKKQFANVDALSQEDKSHYYISSMSISAACALLNIAYMINKFRSLQENRALRTGGTAASCLGALSISGNQTLRITIAAYLAIKNTAEINVPVWLNAFFFATAFGFGSLCAKVEKKRYLTELSHIAWVKRHERSNIFQSTMAFFTGQKEQYMDTGTELRAPLRLDEPGSDEFVLANI